MGRVAAECTKMTNARAERAKLFSLLNMQICDVFVILSLQISYHRPSSSSEQIHLHAQILNKHNKLTIGLWT